MSAKENFEVIFRGVTDTEISGQPQEIIFGHYQRNANFHHIKNIKNNILYIIHPESLAMWTGETDKKGVKIFGGIGTGKDKGGDICKRMEGDCDGKEHEAIYKLLYSDTGYCFAGKVIKSNVVNRGCEIFVMREFEVIGNAFLNPELLEV